MSLGSDDLLRRDGPPRAAVHTYIDVLHPRGRLQCSLGEDIVAIHCIDLDLIFNRRG